MLKPENLQIRINVLPIFSEYTSTWFIKQTLQLHSCFKKSYFHTFPQDYSNSPCEKSCQSANFSSFGFCCLTDWISAALTAISVRFLDLFSDSLSIGLLFFTWVYFYFY